MNVNEIVALAKAGFTASQIATLNSIGVAPTPATPAAPTPATPAAPAAPAAPTPATPAAPAAPTPAALAAPADPFAQILAQLQANAINATQQPQQQTTDDILAEIINPKQ